MSRSLRSEANEWGNSLDEVDFVQGFSTIKF